MNILLIGSGGREHTLAWKLKQSPLCNHLFIAPGNAGTALCGTNLPIAISDFDSLATACVANDIDMILVGPEEPLVKGIYDFFQNRKGLENIKVIGPSKEASQLEGSKAYAKAFMKRHDIPTAAYGEFTADKYLEGVEYIKLQSLPIVLKADGLAAGKGVLICQSHLEAIAEFELMLLRSKFGEAGKKVVIEEFLKGIELSIFVLTDGENYVLLPEAKDYKRIGEADAGLNTGGMGAVSPLPFVTAAFLQKVKERIIDPTIAGFKKDKLDYKGFVFVGLMNDNGEPKVIEYNCRMGDPETEVVIPRIKNDLVELLVATTTQKLHEITIETDERAVATVVAVSGGYPGDYEKGKAILGLDTPALENTIVFHSGTKKEDDDIVTNGGRVLAVTSFGENITEAVEQSNYMLEQLHFEGMYYRTDIGYEFKEPAAL
ncbi:MAG: phosphoribosylamine--glycine ligase [Chitinophagaceae bacterium]|nr:phosphoribosylamine--glycine ligase [Chitinophagaceae bacterium]MBK9484141.1 phosphoribosylamine--glycine ligase [Chitinophagaceae bacterium]MBL0198741.1 phosphoribosylamine--glycine ligase [Chitinophagaceae bacterium]